MEKNLKFDADDPILKALFQEVLDPFFRSQRINSKTAKGNFLANKSETFQTPHRIKKSELTKNLFKPFSEGQTCSLSINYCYGILEVLQKLVYQRELADEKELIYAFKTHFEEKYSGPKSSSVFKLFGEDDFKVPELDKTEWWLYERTGDKPTRNAKWGIAVGKIKFLTSAKQMMVEASFCYRDNRIIEENGVATHDDHKDYVYIDLLSTDGMRKRSSLALRLAEAYLSEQQIMVGHFTYHSVSYQHLVSKTVILQKKSLLPEMSIGDFSTGSAQYLLIPESIRQFLYPRESNRMSLPKRIVTDLGGLTEFLSSSREGKLSVTIKNHFCGDYLVYYKPNPHELQEDKLEIFKNEEAIELQCEYRHYTDLEKRVPQYFFGKPYRNNRKIVIELSNEKTAEDKAENPLLLTFNLPQHFESSQCFPGVLSTLMGEELAPASFVVLIVKAEYKSIPEFESFVERYFKTCDSVRLNIVDDFFTLS